MESGNYPAVTQPRTGRKRRYSEFRQNILSLGDNRNNSEDSRYADIGMVKKRYIAGKLWFLCSPFEKAGFMRG